MPGGSLSIVDLVLRRLRTLEPMLADVHERLAGVVVENLDFEDFIKRYDREFALFYIDPPYWGHEATTVRGCSPGGISRH